MAVLERVEFRKHPTNLESQLVVRQGGTQFPARQGNSGISWRTPNLTKKLGSLAAWETPRSSGDGSNDSSWRTHPQPWAPEEIGIQNKENIAGCSENMNSLGPSAEATSQPPSLQTSQNWR
jgi:hypothetical protein